MLSSSCKDHEGIYVVQTLYFCYFFKLNVRFYDVTVQEINTAGICYDTTLKNLVPDNISS